MKEITLEIIQRCLNECIYCSSNSCRNSENILEFYLCKKVIDEAVKMKFNQINISGGEPFLHPQIKNIINYAKEKGLIVHVYSSGVYNDWGSGSLLPIPLDNEYKIDKIIFNMQADINELHSSIAFPGINQSTRDLSIMKALKLGFDTEINLVPMKCNLNHITETVKKAIDLGCKKINLLGLVMQGRAMENKDLIVMDNEDKEYLDNILKSLKDDYGNKIRIGAPLSKDSSSKCIAGKNKIVVRYDGMVFPCEAFKYKESINDDKDILPMNIKCNSLSFILEFSLYLSRCRDYIDSCKDINCAECPDQKDIGYDCGCKMEIESDNMRKNIFDSHMNNYMAINYDELIGLKVENDKLTDDLKEKFINKYSFCLDKECFDYVKHGYLIQSKYFGQNKLYMPDKISITKEFYNIFKVPLLDSLNLLANNKYAKKIENNIEYNLFLEPIELSDIKISNESKNRFLNEYINSVTYPDKENIKKNLAICYSEDFKNVLYCKGFKLVLKYEDFYVYEYITANQFCRKNLLNLI